MAKSSKSSSSSRASRTERQKVVEQMRAQQRAAERRRGQAIVLVCVLVALGIIVAAAWGPVTDHFRTQKYAGKPIEQIGAAATACQKPTTKPATGDQERPALGTLVHNEEHGYTILWYDDSVAGDSDQLSQVRAIADKFAGTSDYRDKFKAVPWTADDGKPFPSGQHIAFTHWSVGGTENAASGNAEQVGVWQYCSAVSGAALKTFMLDYPFSDSPEPNGV
jgi:hypothetical protein